jgi:hypothetical protein
MYTFTLSCHVSVFLFLVVEFFFFFFINISTWLDGVFSTLRIALVVLVSWVLGLGSGSCWITYAFDVLLTNTKTRIYKHIVFAFILFTSHHLQPASQSQHTKPAPLFFSLYQRKER